MKPPEIKVYMNLATKPALFTPKYNNDKAGTKGGETIRVEVFGLYQVKVSEDDVDAYFVVQLPTGKCVYASVDTIQFINEEGEEDEPPTYCD